jgi:hypothetical protein
MQGNSTNENLHPGRAETCSDPLVTENENKKVAQDAGK